MSTIWWEVQSQSIVPLTFPSYSMQVSIVTNPRIFRDPTPPELALQFFAQLRERPHARILRPGQRNWEIFESLCRKIEAPGNW